QSKLYKKVPLPLFYVLAIAVLTSVLVPGEPSPVLAPEPIRCVPCTQEKLSGCPPVPSNCREVLKEPGCGCCLACALEQGEPCGIYTAHCGTGLRCVPRPEDPHPLHSLTRGRGICTADETEGNVMLENNLLTEDGDIAADQSSLQYLLGLNKPLDLEAHESIMAKVNAIRKKLVKLGPCHTELHSALDTIAASQQALGEKFTTFYLPNCDKHGFYKAKQCETSLVGRLMRCWCVSSWNGKRIIGSSDLTADALCHQEVTH
uniref:Insulin-like growth factor-binding protein 1 n=1 Tax=Electrophorus electricus TaxID=8005 RepID=A0A4W4HSF2_ELEEL